MAEIVLCRIDSRLIHGQVMTKWVNQSGANKIVVVSDELAKDPFMMEIYLLAAPRDVKVSCYTQKDVIESWNANQFGGGKVLLLLPNLKTMKEVYDGGIRVTDIQVGGLGGAPNRKVVFQNITLDDADVEILTELQQKGVKIIFQTIPEDTPQSLEGILKKYRQN
ncbi:PTS system mannose/fructose/N-acetylgalactosamine-transporter subunit IIB [Caproiciproducens sp. CPB-2]|uniref:PTS system mannose/fructose/N-acetylgalactosamine-transporter subunit IIB n=1 Tax=Caproiciproducens sp. CPB-2 TaxID=3030017 RepID=UPI0023DC37E2|nr:PTS sugar transporter subunit IIB [Caproiciproducens sp. CPB-2]MDF1494298.1 PTS sugar transporter subunit IIB [Caproiciproducens sp. CPB-2]